jgi:hypothetical protein
MDILDGGLRECGGMSYEMGDCGHCGSALFCTLQENNYRQTIHCSRVFATDK